jgi:plasmid maintenance system antidote protein VapI
MNVPNRYSEDTEAAQRVARHLAAVMERRGWTKARLAKELGIDRSTVGRMLAGERGIGLGLAVRIARRLLISPHDLLLHEPPDDS